MSYGKWRPCCLGLNVLDYAAGKKTLTVCEELHHGPNVPSLKNLLMIQLIRHPSISLCDKLYHIMYNIQVNPNMGRLRIGLVQSLSFFRRGKYWKFAFVKEGISPDQGLNIIEGSNMILT